MDCQQIRPLIPAHLDGELDVVRDAEVIDHLDHCSACAESALFQAAAVGLVQEKLTRHAAPDELRSRIRKTLRTEVNARPRKAKIILLPRLLGLAASLAIAASAGFFWGHERAQSDHLLDDLVGNHLRSLQVNHLADVVSTDRHTVKPWFAGKSDFSPPVLDLAEKGFPLTGGRLEYFDGHTAAALVFQRRLHVINLYVWPAKAKESLSAGTSEHQGYHVQTWSNRGFNFTAVSDLAANELGEFAQLYRENQP